MAESFQPSTQWRERVEPDEERRFAAYADQFAALQKQKSARFGNGRALHRKQITAAVGELNVLPGLPEFAAQGLFANAGSFPVQVRLSNGGTDRVSDRRPDVRGFAIKVQGVQGDSALGNGPARSQDFLLINHESFAFPRSDAFVELVVAASQSPAALLGHLLRKHGPLGMLREMRKMAKTFGKPFAGFANETLFTAAPIACGPYAVRVRLVPDQRNGAPAARCCSDWNADFSKRLQQHDLQWALQLQPFVREDITPIEDASVSWPTPYTTVATLRLPRQKTDPQSSLAKEVEAGVFDPWQALAAHRPLGDVMRARKVVYYRSQQERGAA